MSGMSRRKALKVIAAATAAPAVLGGCDTGAGGADDAGSAAAGSGARGSGRAAEYVGNPKAAGTLWDPDLIKPVIPWEPVLTVDELAGLAVLCDMIIPADDRSPSASAVGAHEFIDEWVSAPYEGMQRDLVLVRGGLVWLDGEAARRFGEGRRFRDLDDAGKRAICDDICWLERAKTEHRFAARFFAKVRDLTATAFYTTDEGMADIGYIGNVPLAEWGPPPAEALRHVGLDPEVLR